MRKSILAMFVVMIAVFAVACGGNTAKGNGGNTADGGNTAGGGGGGDAAADAFALYKKKGRVWVTKSVMKMQGMDDMVTYNKSEVIDVTDKAAKVKMWSLDKDKKPMAGMEAGTEMEIKFETPKVDAPKCGAKAPEVKKETIKVAAGEFECNVMETEAAGSKTKSWSSVKYPGLPVKSETTGAANMTSELVEFNE